MLQRKEQNAKSFKKEERMPEGPIKKGKKRRGSLVTALIPYRREEIEVI